MIVEQGRDVVSHALDKSIFMANGCSGGFVGEGCTIHPGATIGDHRLDDRIVRTMVKGELQISGYISMGPIIGDGAVIGPNVKVMPGRQIGPRAIVEAGVVVLRNIPAKCRVGLT